MDCIRQYQCPFMHGTRWMTCLTAFGPTRRCQQACIQADWSDTATSDTNSGHVLRDARRSRSEHYSPSTRYKDYAISRPCSTGKRRSRTTQLSPTGQRYIHQARTGRQHPALCPSHRLNRNGRTMPVRVLGPAEYVSHKDERPIAFVGNCDEPMPADFFRVAKVAIS